MDRNEIHEWHVPGLSEILQFFEQAQRFLATAHNAVSVGESGEGYRVFIAGSQGRLQRLFRVVEQVFLNAGPAEKEVPEGEGGIHFHGIAALLDGFTEPPCEIES